MICFPPLSIRFIYFVSINWKHWPSQRQIILFWNWPKIDYYFWSTRQGFNIGTRSRVIAGQWYFEPIVSKLYFSKMKMKTIELSPLLLDYFRYCLAYVLVCLLNIVIGNLGQGEHCTGVSSCVAINHPSSEYGKSPASPITHNNNIDKRNIKFVSVGIVLVRLLYIFVFGWRCFLSLCLFCFVPSAYARDSFLGDIF